MAKKKSTSKPGGMNKRIKERDKVTMSKVVELADNVASCAFKGREVCVEIPTRTRSNTIWNKKRGILQMGDAKASRELFNLNQAKQFMQTCLHGNSIKELIDAEKSLSLRGMYYKGLHTVAGTKEKTFAEQSESGKSELLRQRETHSAAAEFRTDPLRVLHSGNSQPLRDVEPAMIRGQGHRIINAARIQHAQEITNLAVELEQLEAHLLALGAVGVPDVIRRRQADREDVGRWSAAELHFVDQPGSEREGVAVELRRGAERGEIARGAAELPGADRLAAAGDRDDSRLGLAQRRRHEARSFSGGVSGAVDVVERDRRRTLPGDVDRNGTFSNRERTRRGDATSGRRLRDRRRGGRR